MAFGNHSDRPRPKSGADRVKEHRKRDRHIPYADPADKRRRTRLEKNPAKWLRYYLPDRFPEPFGAVHQQIITACIRAMTAGTSITVAAPRGFGKTSVLWGMALYGVLSGICRFPVVIGWKANAGLELLDQWLAALSGNELLRADYPCQCLPFEESTASMRLRGIYRTIDPDQLAGCDVRKGRGTVLLPDAQEPTTKHAMPHVALAGASMNGSIKGLNVGLITGESIRPDIVLMDDPQDEQTADSETLVRKVIRKIDYGIRSLSGPRRRLTVMAAVTCVAHGDVSEHLLTRAGTETIKVGQITTWPAGWADDKSTTRAAWDEWNATRLRGLEALDGGKAARVYYRKHKAALTRGMAVSWKYRYQIGDGRRASDPDALFAAMWDYYDLGEMAFMAERQNAPMNPEAESAVRVTPEIILSRALGPPRGIAPEDTINIVAGADVNPGISDKLGSRITWACAAFALHQSESVMAYGIHKLKMPTDPTPSQQVSVIYAGLNELRARLGIDFGCDVLVYDAKGWYNQGVSRLDALKYPNLELPGVKCGAIGAEGWPASKYRPWHKTAIKKFESCHLNADRIQQTMVRWLAWDVDWFNLQQLRAWLATPGAPGGCVIYRGQIDGEFLQQATTRSFMGMIQKHASVEYDWSRAVGRDDYGDALAMCRAGAAYCGIGTGGQQQRPKRKLVAVVGGRSPAPEPQQEKEHGSETEPEAARIRAVVGRRR